MSKLLDTILKPCNESNYTCAVIIKNKSILRSFFKKKKTMFTLETHNLLSGSITQIPIEIPYDHFLSELIHDEFIAEKAKTKKQRESIVLQYMAHQVIFYIIAYCTQELTKTKVLPTSMIDNKFYEYLVNNHFQLLLRCESKSFCLGVIESIHLCVRELFKLTNMKYPTAEVFARNPNPVATVVPNEFSNSMGQEIKKPFLISLELEGFEEGVGAVGFLCVHGENNLPSDPDSPICLGDDFDLEETLDKLDPRRLDDV